MANSFITNNDIAEHMLAHFINSCQFVRLANRYYQDEFRSVNGFERGNTIRILRPTYFVPRQGVTMSISDVQERETYLSLDYQDGQDIALTSLQMTTSIDDLSQRILRPIAIGLANLVDVRIATECNLRVYNKFGTSGAALNSFASFNNMKNQLFKRGVVGDYEAILNPNDATLLQNSLQNAFNTTLNEEISIFGRIGELSNVGVYQGQNVQSFTNNTAGGTPLVNGANQTGSVLVTDGWTPGTTLNQGMVIYISNGTRVASVNPVSRISLGGATDDLQRFVVTETVTDDGAGNIDIPIDPPITLTGPYQTVTASPDNNAAITIVGGSATTYYNNYMFTKEALSVAVVPLITPPGAVNAVVMTDPDTGISMRVIDAYDVVNDRAIKRVDLLYGIQIFPQYAVGYISSGTA
ncbi:MAG: hypothetical protein EKK56_00795 [Flavobacteriaceae bacterium]|nr:MAG: hypothetical protein EKK56_00795 [Flavobacteriaceae bacterium]